MIRKLVSIAAALALLVAFPVAAPAAAPPGFLGISPQSPPTEPDFELMERAELDSVRLPLYWSAVESVSPFFREPDWDGFDHAVELAARHEMRVLPFVWGSPPWVSSELRLEPVAADWQRRAWTSFLRRAVRRYGPDGVFWQENEDLPYQPIRKWEIWNEQNIVTFGAADPERFARFVRISGQALKGSDPGANVILGGFFGRPLQVPPNVHPGRFLSRVYRDHDVKRWFDGVGLHPYVARATAIEGQIRNLRRVMRAHNDAATPIYVTEMGWGSDDFESRWERGVLGQAQELDQALSMLTHYRRAWRIGGVWWFSWADANNSCQFCDSAGLLTERREAKPSWYVFNAWTGGEADTVPRAAFGD